MMRETLQLRENFSAEPPLLAGRHVSGLLRMLQEPPHRPRHRLREVDRGVVSQ